MPSDTPPPVMRVYHHPSGRWGWALAYGPADGDARGVISSTLLFDTPEIAEADACEAARAFDFWARESASMRWSLTVGLTSPSIHPEPHE